MRRVKAIFFDKEIFPSCLYTIPVLKIVKMRVERHLMGLQAKTLNRSPRKRQNQGITLCLFGNPLLMKHYSVILRSKKQHVNYLNDLSFLSRQTYFIFIIRIINLFHLYY